MVYRNGENTIRLRTTEGFQVVMCLRSFSSVRLFFAPSVPANFDLHMLVAAARHRENTWPAENNAAHSFLDGFHLFLDEWIPTIQDYNVGTKRKFFGSIFDAVSSPKTKIEMGNFICR